MGVEHLEISRQNMDGYNKILSLGVTIKHS